MNLLYIFAGLTGLDYLYFMIVIIVRTLIFDISIYCGTILLIAMSVGYYKKYLTKKHALLGISLAILSILGGIVARIILVA